MSPRTRILTAAILAVLSVGCSSNKVLVPPRIDLARYGTLGMIEFSSGRPDPAVPGATREFLATLQSAQPGTPVLELGPEPGVLGTVRRPVLDVQAIQAIGKHYKVDALVLGALEFEEIRPNVTVGSGVGIRADVAGTLSTRIVDTRTGATIWTTAATGREPIAGVRVGGSGISGGGTLDPSGARDKLARDLVARATSDFWPRWERR